MYTLKPLMANVVIEPIKPKDVKEYTGRTLTSLETGGLDVLQYGKVITIPGSEKEFVKFDVGDIVLYEKLASHKTDIGDPRLALVHIEHIHGKLEKTDAN